MAVPSLHAPVSIGVRRKHESAQWWFDRALLETSLGGLMINGQLKSSLKDWTGDASSFPPIEAIALYLKFRLLSRTGRGSRYVKALTLEGWSQDIMQAWSRATDRTVDEANRSQIRDVCTSLTRTFSLSMTPAIRANISTDLIFNIIDAVWSAQQLPRLSPMGRLCMSTYIALVAQTGVRISSILKTTPSARDTTFKDFTIYVMANSDPTKPCKLFGYWTLPHVKNFKHQIIAIGDGPTCTTSAPLMVLLNYVQAGGATIQDILDLLRPGSLTAGQVKKVVFRSAWRDIPVLQSAPNHPATYRWISAHLYKISLALGLEVPITTHAWRWFVAQATLRAGWNLPQIREHLGLSPGSTATRVDLGRRITDLQRAGTGERSAAEPMDAQWQMNAMPDSRAPRTITDDEREAALDSNEGELSTGKKQWFHQTNPCPSTSSQRAGLESVGLAGPGRDRRAKTRVDDGKVRAHLCWAASAEVGAAPQTTRLLRPTWAAGWRQHDHSRG